jgi:hypothetical protein
MLLVVFSSFSSLVNSFATSFVLSNGSTLNANNSAILGGNSIIGNNDDTVYVPQLNISTIGVGTSINNLGIDSDGFVVVGTDVTGSTSPLSDVLSVGNNTGSNDIILDNGDLITNVNGSGSIGVSDSGDGSQIIITVTDPTSDEESYVNLKNNQVSIVTIDSVTLDQSNVSLSSSRVQLTTPLDGLNSVFINDFNYGRSALLTTGGTSVIIYTLPITAFPTNVTQVNVYCSGVDVLTKTSGITQELVSSYVSDGISITQITTGATTTYLASNFPSSVEATLIDNGNEILVRVIGQPSTSINWKCKVRWSV